MNLQRKRKRNGSVVHLVPEGAAAALCGDRPWHSGVWIDPHTPNLLPPCQWCLQKAIQAGYGEPAAKVDPDEPTEFVNPKPFGEE